MEPAPTAPRYARFTSMPTFERFRQSETNPGRDVETCDAFCARRTAVGCGTASATGSAEARLKGELILLGFETQLGCEQPGRGLTLTVVRVTEIE